MRKRLGSLLLMLALTASAVPMQAMAVEVQEETQIVSALDSEYNESMEGLNEDPETYKKTHRGRNNETVVERNVSRTMLFANQSIQSPYTKKVYTLPENKKISHGIDVSYHSDNVDWSKVKKAGMEWAILRVGYTGYGSGKQYKDVKFDSYIKDTAALGIPVGVYIYSQATSVEMAKAEAQFCLDNIKGHKITLPIVMDVEFAEDSNGNHTGILYNAKLTAAKQTEVIEAFCKTIKDAGYTPMVYANKSMLMNNMYVSQLEAKYPIWLANYTANTTYAGKYSVWQYADTGVIDGINYPIDCNFGLDFGTNFGSGTHPSKETTMITLDSDQLTAAVGSVNALTAKVEPADTSDKITWKSSNTAVATVNSSGSISALKCGTAVITAKSGKMTASCTVTVTPARAKITAVESTSDKKIKLSWKKTNGAARYYIYRSKTGLSGSFSIVKTTADLSWKDTSVASDRRYYYRVKAYNKIGDENYKGKVSATVSGVGGKEKVSISLSSTSLNIPLGMSEKLNATTNPSGTIETVFWKSSADDIATVENGVVTGTKIGAASVTAEFCGVKADCVVNVLPHAIPRFSMAIENNTIKITWEATNGATRYYVYRSETGEEGSWGKSICSTTKKAFSDKNVKDGELYYYRIVAAAKAADGKYYRAAPSPTREIVALFED